MTAGIRGPRCLVALVLAALLSPAPARAGVGPVAVFLDPEIGPYRAVLDGFRESCRCTVVEYPVRQEDPPAAFAGFGSTKPDLVLAIGLDALARAGELRGVRILSTMVPRSQAALVAGNGLAGIDMALPPEEHLAAIRRLFPGAKRIGLLYDPAQTGEYVAAATRAADSLGVRLVLREVTRAADVPRLLESLRQEIDLFWMLPDPTVVREETTEALLLFSFENKVPVFTFARKYVAMGALAALVIDPREIGVEAAEMARTLPAAGAGEPRWDFVRKHSLVVNRKVGRKMGVRFDLDTLGEAVDAID